MPEGASGAVKAPPPTALGGLKVLELANLYAGPSIGAILGDLGADVVKVEPPEGDALRAIGARDDGPKPGVWTLVTRSKRLISLDYRQPEGRGTLIALTAVADVVIVNQPAALLAELDCTYTAIAARNRRAIVVQVSGFGSVGPYAERGANGTICEAFAGVAHQLRNDDGEPQLTALLLGDTFAAMNAAMGVLAACYWRDAQGGTGQLIDAAMFEALLPVLAPALVAWRPDAPHDQAGRSPGGSGLRSAMKTSDGAWVVATAYSDAQIARLLAAVGIDATRLLGDELAASAREWVGGQTLDAVLSAFERARITITPVHSFGTLLGDPQVRLRGSVQEIAHPGHGVVRMPRPAPLLTATPAVISRTADKLGGDNESVLADWLGER